MAYQVKRRYERPDGSVVWRVIHEDYTGAKRWDRNVSKAEYGRLGLRPDMTIDEARQVIKSLNAASHLKKQEERRNRIAARLREEDLKDTALLPEIFTRAFEREILLKRVCRGKAGTKHQQILCYWRAAKRVIRKLSLEPADWSDSPELVYNYAQEKRFSLSYTAKIIRVLNLWGRFICKRQSKYFENVPTPRGQVAQEIREAYYQKRPRGLRSDPITPEHLRKAKDSVKPEQLNWLTISVWFGLRPTEIDALKDPQTWRVEKEGKYRLLAVYQSKLVTLPPEERWKFIPIILPKQEAALKLIEAGALERPLVKTIKKHVNARANRRGGRKGFVALMYEQAKVPQAVASRWLGHTSERTTEAHYVQRKKQAVAF